MICPDPTRRIMADEAYHALWKLTPAPAMDTPTFVRKATVEQSDRDRERERAERHERERSEREQIQREKSDKRRRELKSTRKGRPAEDNVLRPAKSVNSLQRKKEDTPPKDTQRELAVCNSRTDLSAPRRVQVPIQYVHQLHLSIHLADISPCTWRRSGHPPSIAFRPSALRARLPRSRLLAASASTPGSSPFRPGAIRLHADQDAATSSPPLGPGAARLLPRSAEPLRHSPLPRRPGRAHPSPLAHDNSARGHLRRAVDQTRLGALERTRCTPRCAPLSRGIAVPLRLDLARAQRRLPPFLRAGQAAEAIQPGPGAVHDRTCCRCFYSVWKLAAHAAARQACFCQSGAEEKGEHGAHGRVRHGRSRGLRPPRDVLQA